MDINNYAPSYSGLYGKNFVSVENLSPEEIYEVLYTAKLLKMKTAAGERLTTLFLKQIMMISKTSEAGLRISFEAAIRKLCGGIINLSLGGKQLENFVATGDVLPVMKELGLDGIIVSTEENGDAFSIKNLSSVPVINGNNLASPCLAVSALLTLWEKYGKLRGLTISAVGDAKNNPGIIEAAVKCGINVHAVSPEENEISEEIVDSHAIYGTILKFSDLERAVSDADAIVILPGESAGSEFCVTENIVNSMGENASVIGFFPLEKDRKIEGELFDDSRFLKEKLAENLLYAEEAVLSLLFNKKIDK